MDLHMMQQVKRLFAWADADDDTRNMELHLQVAFGLVAEQGGATQPKCTLTPADLDCRNWPVMREVQLTQAYRWERANLAMSIADALHCKFAWVGSLTQDSPTVGYFVGCGPHVDRVRLLFEVIDPDLRLLTRFIGPSVANRTGPEGAPSGDGLDFYHSRSQAMMDVVSWVGERLAEAETLVAARVGLVDDFAGDGEIARSYVEEMWGDTANMLATMEGLPDLPMVDGVSETRFDEFLAELKGAEERLRDYVALAVDEGESDDVGSREYVDFRNRENEAGATGRDSAADVDGDSGGDRGRKRGGREGRDGRGRRGRRGGRTE